MTLRFTHVPAAPRFRDSQEGGAPFFFDAAAALATLRLIERTGFSGVVIDDDAGPLANLDIAAQAAQGTSGIEIVLTHAAGVLAPVVAAGQIAALDALSGGRLSLRMAGDPVWHDGGRTSGHAASYARLDEYLVLLKRLWANDAPFEHQGPFYSIRDGHVAAKGPQGAAIPIRMAGLSGTAIRVAARHADVIELEPGTPEEVRTLVGRVTAAAREFGRADRIRFALPVAAGSGTPAETALRLLPYVALGVSEFMVTGLETAGEIAQFGDATAPLLVNSIRRRVAPDPVRPPYALVNTLPRRS